MWYGNYIYFKQYTNIVFGSLFLFNITNSQLLLIAKINWKENEPIFNIEIHKILSFHT